MDNETGNNPEGNPEKIKKEWPLSWVVIAILVYVLGQVAYILFFAR